MPSTYRIRPATNADSSSVQTLIFGVLREYGLKADPLSTDADLDDLQAHYSRRGGSFSVLETGDGKVIGTVGIQPRAPGVCELRKMYLSREHRGRGLGRRLLDHGLAEARRLGFGRVVLETASVLKEAIRLYEQYGFRRYQPEHLVPRCDQAYCLDLGEPEAT
ncbi:MAG: GNAT family N-acetyltransferase [Tepidisphaeraceae bacterium]